MKRDARIGLDVDEFVGARLALYKEGVVFPEKPDRPCLRRSLAADGCQPDDSFFVELTVGALAQGGGEVNCHGLICRQGVFF